MKISSFFHNDSVNIYFSHTLYDYKQNINVAKHYTSVIQNPICSVWRRNRKHLYAFRRKKPVVLCIEYPYLKQCFAIRLEHFDEIKQAVWYFLLWSFKTMDTKLERFLHKNQHTQRKLLNFENWTNGEPQSRLL